MYFKLSFRILQYLSMTLMLVLFVNTVYSQSYTDVAAYYLNLEKDTIKGYIKIEDNYRLAQSFSFKNPESEKEYQIIKPTDCLGFFYDENRTFVSYTDSLNSDTLFMELLNEGPINLYAYYLMNKTVYYLLKQVDSRYYRLAKEEDKIVVRDDRNPGDEYTFEQKEYLYEDKKYLGILNLVMQDCEKIKSKIPNTKWNKQSMIKLVDTYNNCIDPSTNYKSNLRKSKLGFGIEIGTLLHAIPEFGSFYAARYENSEYKSGVGLNIKGYGKFQVLKDLSIDLGIGYSYIDMNIFSIHSNNYHYEDDHFKFHHLDIPLNLQYNLTKTKLSPFVYIHTAYSFILSNEIEINSNSEELSGTFPITNLNTTKWEWGGGIGASFDKTYVIKLEYTNTDYQRGINE
ncbi:outer membrane beta-barrel protein [Lentimicrobium sp. S6]|uniref:outer membrane beta-barrel protein n=1 Tax=Lentimicrobium sp. S6 TaxID=2735872 RepID=UPI001551E013|nr:outer membrane beta-barrel protein [Lentimicrobium sp. S6]NPD45636.1 PorT family protein [Lentimicrobium sp. S6]